MPSLRVRARELERVRFELIPIVPCGFPFARGLKLLASDHSWRFADQAHRFTLALWDHLQDAIARVLRVKRHTLHDAAEAGVGRGRGRHQQLFRACYAL
jgi:hypothetical protein